MTRSATPPTDSSNSLIQPTRLQEMGLAFDEWDMDYYTHLFRDDMKRDPTNVELFDIAQSNSEHSRHWFFRCVEQPRCLTHTLWTG